MNLARLLAPVVFGSAILVAGCSAVEENGDSRSRDLSQEESIPTQYSIDEILQVYTDRVVPLYANPDPRLAQQRFVQRQDEIFSVLTEYLSGVSEDVLLTTPRSQRKPLSLVYYDFGVVLALQEKPELAVLAYRVAIRLDNKNPAILFGYARSMYDLDCLLEALYYFEKCWHLDRQRLDARRFARRIEQELHLPRL